MRIRDWKQQKQEDKLTYYPCVSLTQETWAAQFPAGGKRRRKERPKIVHCPKSTALHTVIKVTPELECGWSQCGWHWLNSKTVWWIMESLSASYASSALPLATWVSNISSCTKGTKDTPGRNSFHFREKQVSPWSECRWKMCSSTLIPKLCGSRWRKSSY